MDTRILQGADNNLSISFYKIATSYIPENSRVLNLGCGLNFNFERILSQEKKVSITSLDILPAKKPPFVDKFIIQNVEEPFLLKQKFDVVTFFELIEHIDKTDILILNCFNNLKDGGLLIFPFLI